jgi:hypothetical protein
MVSVNNGIWKSFSATLVHLQPPSKTIKQCTTISFPENNNSVEEILRTT